MGKYTGMNFKEIMNEERSVNRWFITMVFIAGAFTGALLSIAFMLTALA